MLCEGIASTRGRYAAYLHRDRVNGLVRARRGSRLAAITSGGAIPENSLYTVVAQPEGAVVGTVDEDFAVESIAGDIMLLGNTSWRIRRVSSGSVLVEDAQGAPPTIPFWRGEAPARTDELSAHVSELREKISSFVPCAASDATGQLTKDAIAAVTWLKLECGLDDAGAEQAVEYVVTGRATLGAVPTQTTIIAERFFDESGGMQLVIHAPFGGRINKAWGLALRKRFCRSFNFEQQACPENLAAGDINIPAHPLVREVMKDVLTEAMDVDGLECVLHDIASGRIKCLAVDTPVSSQFSHEILNANPYAYLDDVPLEERRARAVEMRRVLPEALLGEIGRLDPAAIAEVCDEAWPDVRDAEELHDALLTLIALPLGDEGVRGNSRLSATLSNALPAWTLFFERLVRERRAGLAHVGNQAYWVASERAPSFIQVFPSATFDVALPDVESPAVSREEALLAFVKGWTTHSGPVTSNQLSNVLKVPAFDIEKTLLRLESSGVVLRGKFAGVGLDESASGSTEWCERRLLARIHGLTLGRLRKEIQSVTPAQFMNWLLSWQHVAPSTQLLGERGTLEAIRQMQGFEAPANSWERQILSRRIADFDPKVLDQLCLTGAVGWGRLSPHPATLEALTDGKRRVIPTSVAPITFFVREDSDWMIPQRDAGEADTAGLSPDAVAVLQYLRQRGASFFADIVRGTAKLKSEVETALWELVAAGLLTADGFDNLRALIDPKRRAGQGSARSSRPRHSTGRWSLLYSGEIHDRTRALEAICWMLLRRYGIVFRELLTRETILPKWRELLITLRQLEDRGEVRGGRFVSNFLGEQFALPVAVESLRAARSQKAAADFITVSAADPLNLVGIIVPGERVPANSGRAVAFRDGVAVPSEELTNVVRMPLAR